eukprot:2976577-Prymnesium_polylepis.1
MAAVRASGQHALGGLLRKPSGDALLVEGVLARSHAPLVLARHAQLCADAALQALARGARSGPTVTRRLACTLRDDAAWLRRRVGLRMLRRTRGIPQQ